jgi:hypothetical protein
MFPDLMKSLLDGVEGEGDNLTLLGFDPEKGWCIVGKILKSGDINQ